jgi:arylsulfatase
MINETKKHRSHLPIATPERTGLITYDAKDPDTSFPPIEQLRPPKGAPNVLLILLDDAGFGSSSAFGGPCQAPNAEKLAANGLKYNRFHTTALCSPTRAALLTGRNHHSAGMGGITEIATGAPGYSSILPNTISPLARTLKLNGYSTAQFGKCHEVPVWETSPVGPFDAWPTGGAGFEYFYGFIGGEANQWYPTLYEGTTPVEPKKTPEEGYHFMEDMTDKAMAWVAQQKALHPTSPSSPTSRPAQPTRHIMCPRNGPTSTKASSTRAGTSCAKKPSNGRRSWASSRRIASLPRATRRSPRGTTCRTR